MQYIIDTVLFRDCSNVSSDVENFMLDITIDIVRVTGQQSGVKIEEKVF